MTAIQKAIRARLEESRGEYVSTIAIAGDIGHHIDLVEKAIEDMYFKSAKARDMTRTLSPEGNLYRLKEE